MPPDDWSLLQAVRDQGETTRCPPALAPLIGDTWAHFGGLDEASRLALARVVWAYEDRLAAVQATHQEELARGTIDVSFVQIYNSRPDPDDRARYACIVLFDGSTDFLNALQMRMPLKLVRTESLEALKPIIEAGASG